MEKNLIVERIKQFIGGNPAGSYYVGITSNPNQRLSAHSVLPGKSISCEADDIESARLIEDYFVNKFGTDGGSGGGDEKSIFIYCYKIDNSTNQHT